MHKYLCNSINKLVVFQNQFGYRDGTLNSAEGSVSGAQACGNPEAAAAGGTTLSLEEQRCNGSLHKKNNLNPSVAVTAEDSGGQRYSADPTIFLGERTSRGDTDEDGYMTPMKDKHSSGN